MERASPRRLLRPGWWSVKQTPLLLAFFLSENRIAMLECGKCTCLSYVTATVRTKNGEQTGKGEMGGRDGGTFDWSSRETLEQ